MTKVALVMPRDLKILSVIVQECVPVGQMSLETAVIDAKMNITDFPPAKVITIKNILEIPIDLDSFTIDNISVCSCNPNGSENPQCNDNGQCPCKENFSGERCDSCAEGYSMGGFPTCQVLRFQDFGKLLLSLMKSL